LLRGISTDDDDDGAVTVAWAPRPCKIAAASGASLRSFKPFHFMNGVARSFDAGLSLAALAALARRGGAVGAAGRSARPSANALGKREVLTGTRRRRANPKRRGERGHH